MCTVTEKMKWANQRAILMVEMGTEVILHGICQKQFEDVGTFCKIIWEI